MNFLQKLFSKERSAPAHKLPSTGPSAAKTKLGTPAGFIEYVLLVVSHPEEPQAPHVAGFLNDLLPELKSLGNDSAKIGILWETKPMSSIDMTALAVEAFGASFVNNDKYTYRTIHTKISGGEAKCLVAYGKASS